MSVACQKQYQIQIKSPALKAYWKFDELADPRLDSVNGFSLSSFNGSPAGSAPGIIGNALHFPTTGANEFNTVTPPAFNFPYNQNDLSFTCWVKVNGMGGGGGFFFLLEFTDLAFTTTIFTIWLRISNPLPTWTVQDLTFGTFFVSLGNPSIGAWHFVAVTYKQSTNTISVSIDNGVPITTNPTTPFGAAGGLAVQIQESGGSYDMLVDEAFVGSGIALTPSQITQAYGGGAPPPWPWTFI